MRYELKVAAITMLLALQTQGASADVISSSSLSNGSVSVVGASAGFCSLTYVGYESSSPLYASATATNLGSSCSPQAGGLLFDFGGGTADTSSYAGDVSQEPNPSAAASAGSRASVYFQAAQGSEPSATAYADISLNLYADAANPIFPLWGVWTEWEESQAAASLYLTWHYWDPTLSRWTGVQRGDLFRQDFQIVVRRELLDDSVFSEDPAPESFSFVDALSGFSSFVAPIDGFYRLDVEAGWHSRAVTNVVIAEPGTLALLSLGLLGLGLSRRKKA